MNLIFVRMEASFGKVYFNQNLQMQDLLIQENTELKILSIQAKHCYGGLNKTLLELEDEIAKKGNSIYIDQENNVVVCSSFITG